MTYVLVDGTTLAGFCSPGAPSCVKDWQLNRK